MTMPATDTRSVSRRCRGSVPPSRASGGGLGRGRLSILIRRRAMPSCLSLLLQAGEGTLEPMARLLLQGAGMSAHSTSAVTFSPHRVGAMVLRYLYLLRSSWPRLLELIYWPAVQMLDVGLPAALHRAEFRLLRPRRGIFIGAVLLWDILFRGQLGFSISFLEEMWARNLGNLMISPLRPIEFVCALMIMSVDPAGDRHGAGDAAGDRVLRLQCLRPRLRAGGVLLESDPDQLGGRHLRLRRAAAQRHGRGNAGLDAHVPAPAAHLRLLPGERAAGLAAGGRLGAAADLRVRGHARAGDRARVPRRPDARGVRAQRALFRRRPSSPSCSCSRARAGRARCCRPANRAEAG